ncbi:hypothetical protein FGG08_002035 [Glutinoglossum americanum]|uniref:Endoplasmic reticulum junction formation protein lunapark n=1 Tax=Glutinoglossum americanum TaxID=1670608 RepID=A0A9P8L258_9PEZI|nr:hypothetical protein FGG08_002035 [Glutinoglossum americanum]
MVSLWPWRVDDTSPASFERTLSLISTKISKNSTQLDSLHQSSRRLKALWTLYTSFAYILYSIVLALVLGWKNWGALEYGGMIGGPLLIFLVRMLFSTYYNYRISNVISRLQDLHKEREVTIEKLKEATKYDSTQQLLEKYGSTPHKSPQTSSPSRDKQNASPQEKDNPRGQQRLALVPPATANILRDPPTPQRLPPDIKGIPERRGASPQYPHPPPLVSGPEQGPPEFAPNAFPMSPQSTAGYSDEPRWYDRVLDLLLGEDETLPRNRLALICAHCRLVNGQAPPGIKRLEDLGKWRCGGCGGWNGEEDEAKKIIAEVRDQAKADTKKLAQSSSDDSEEVHTGSDNAVLVPDRDGAASEEQENTQNPEDVGGDEESDEPKPSPSPKPKRGRPKGSGKRKG